LWSEIDFRADKNVMKMVNDGFWEWEIASRVKERWKVEKRFGNDEDFLVK
jgi:hypothetical protein